MEIWILYVESNLSITDIVYSTKTTNIHSNCKTLSSYDIGKN